MATMHNLLDPAVSRARIVSQGAGRNTQILDADGQPINWGGSGVSRIEILPITGGSLVTAIITVEVIGLDIEGDVTVGALPQD